MRTLLRISHQLTPRCVAACASVLVLAACSAPPGAELDDDGTPPEFSGSLPAGAGGPAPGATGAQAPAGAAPAPGPIASANPTPTAPSSSEQPASSGTPIAPSTAPSSNGNNAGANSGAGGASMVPAGGDQGAGGSSMDDPGVGGASGETPPVAEQPQPTPVTPPPVETPAPPVATGPDIPCPADAFFCSGFENGFPAGTQNIVGGGQIPNAFALDTAERNSGAQSLLLPTQPTIRFVYRVLAVPVTAQQFWARMFIRTDVAFGSSDDHESLFAPSTGNLTQDNNNEGRRIELSEQFGYMLLNVNDRTPEPAVRRQLSANEWHCVEAHYDGDAGQVEIFADGQQFIDDEDVLFQMDFQTFRLGYMQFNGTPRNVWYDDVILSTSPVGCD